MSRVHVVLDERGEVEDYGLDPFTRARACDRCELCGWRPADLDERESFLPLDEVIFSSGRIAPACARCWLVWPHGHKRRVQWRLRCPGPTSAEILEALRDRSAA